MKKISKKLAVLIGIIVISVVVTTAFGLNGYFGGGSGSEVLSTTTSTQGLVGYWDFNEGTGQTANDSSDSNNDGTRGANSSVGTDDPIWTTGKAGNRGALNFDGSNDFVSIADSPSITLTAEYTISHWVKGDVVPGSASVTQTISKADRTYNFSWSHITASFRQACALHDGAWKSAQITSTLSANTWYYIVCRKDSSTLKVFLNGIEEGSTAVGTPQSPDAILTIGSGVSTGGTPQDFFDGQVDEPRIYNRALSASEIRYLYNRGGPVAHYKFDEGSGTTAFDSTDITNDGTITGATYTQGKFGTALNFDGTDDVVTVTNANPIDFDVGLKTGATFSSWIRADNAGEGTGGQIVFKGTNTWLRVDTLSSGRLDLEASLDLATTDATLNTSQTITQSTWHHVVMTYTDDSDDEIELYVNGILVGTSTNGDGAPAGTDTNNLLIAGTTTNNFDGLIDDFRVFGYARTPEEIRLDYNAGLAAKFGGSPNQDINRGLVGYWDFSEGTGQTANDSSDSNNDGTRGASSSVGTDDPAWTTGPSTGSGRANGGALDFDGSNDFVSIADSPSITLTAEYTISHWVKGDVVPGSASITQTISKADRTYNFSWSHTNASFRQACALHDGAWKSVGITSTLSANTWYYIVCRKDSSTLKVFLNGIEEGSTAVGTPAAPDAILTIGSGVTTGGTPESFFDGQVDEPRIYNRALSASEIRYLYNRGGPVAHYKFDEGSGTTAFDSTDITNDGTITGATFTQGQYGTALNFDGSDDVVTVTNVDPIDFDVGLKTAVTFSSWIRADNAGEGTGGQIIWKGTNTWLRVDTLSSGKLDLEASLDLATTDATLNISTALNQSQWHHVVMTYTDDSDDEIELYVDGILVGTSTNGDGAPAGTDTNNLLIAGTTTNNFDGLIDDARAFGYARTPEEIRADYNAGLSTHFR